MVGILGHEDLREQAGRWHAFVDHLRRHRRLDERLTPRTRPLAANVPLDLKHARRVVELFAHVLADALQRAAAAANRDFRLMPDFNPRQVRWQRRALGLVLRRRRVLGALQRVELRGKRFEVRLDRFVEQAALLTVHLLTARCKLPALEYCDLVCEQLDLELPAA